MIRYETEIKGVAELLQGLEAAPRVLHAEINRALDDSAAMVASEVRSLTPVVTGRLWESERYRVDRTAHEARIFTRVAYAGWVEAGRGPVHARPGGWLKFRIKGRGPWLFKRSVGPASGRFMFKEGLDNSLPRIEARFREVAQAVARSVIARTINRRN